MKIKAIIYLLAIMTLSNIAFAEFTDPVLQWSNLGKVTHIKPIQYTGDNSDGWIEVQTKTSTGSHGEYWLNGSTNSGKSILSVLLTAQTTGADVKIFYHKTALLNFFGHSLHPIYSVSIETP